MSEASANLTTTIGEATVTARASWDPPDPTLTPGEPFLLSVTASVSATGPGPAYYSLTVIPKVSGAWNRNVGSVVAEGQCGDSTWGGDPMQCSADTTTDVMQFDAPSGGDTFDMGVSVLNCGGACEVRWTYEWVDSTVPDTDAEDVPDAEGAHETDGAIDPWTPQRSAQLLAALRADADLLDTQRFVWTAVIEAIFDGRPAEEGLLVLRDLTDSFFEVRIRRLEQAGGASDSDVAALIAHLRDLRALRAAEIDQSIADVRATADDSDALDPSTVRTLLTDGPSTTQRSDPGADDAREHAEAVDVLTSVHDANDQPDLHQALDDQAVRALDEPQRDTDPESDADSATPTTAPEPDQAGTFHAEDALDLRPLRFVNDGFTPVTVRAETYQPAADLGGTAMSSASTVVFVDPNPSAYLDLPRGRYTFCYDWELGDVDGDDMTDYAHRSSGPVSLTAETPRDPALAPTVTLSPPSRTSTPNGSCPGTGATGAEPAAPLTSAQRSATASATYAVTCDYAGGSQQMFSKQYRFEFSDGTAVWNDAEAAPIDLTVMEPNVYQSDGGSTIPPEYRDAWGITERGVPGGGGWGGGWGAGGGGARGVGVGGGGRFWWGGGFGGRVRGGGWG